MRRASPGTAGGRAGMARMVVRPGFARRPAGYRRSMVRQVLIGAAAGAAGTTALNAVTYLDMAVRARPASDTPERTVQRLAELAGVEIPGEPEQRQARLSALGALTGIVAGVGVGALYGLAQGLGLGLSTRSGAAVATATVLAAANGPMVLLGVTDPRSWSGRDWLADLVPHAAYGAVTAATYAAATSRRRGVFRIRRTSRRLSW